MLFKMTTCTHKVATVLTNQRVAPVSWADSNRAPTTCQLVLLRVGPWPSEAASSTSMKSKEPNPLPGADKPSQARWQSHPWPLINLMEDPHRKRRSRLSRVLSLGCSSRGGFILTLVTILNTKWSSSPWKAPKVPARADKDTFGPLARGILISLSFMIRCLLSSDFRYNLSWKRAPKFQRSQQIFLKPTKSFQFCPKRSLNKVIKSCIND